MTLYLIYTLYITSGLIVFYFTQHSKNYINRVFGIIFFTYQIPLFIKNYEFDYFGRIIPINFTSEHYIFAIVFNLTLLICLQLGGLKTENKNSLIFKKFLHFLIISAILAFLVDVSLNTEYLTSNKELRFSNEVQKIPNLIIIDIDWLIIFLSFGLTLFSKEKRIIGSILVLACITTGIWLGMRYYAVVPAIYAYLKITENSNRKARPIYSLFFIATIPTAGSILDSLKSYWAYYEWVSDKSFLSYWLDKNNDIFTSGEIGAIGANYFIGINTPATSADPLSYLASIIPFANRFYDFSQQKLFYSSIASQLSDIDIYSGQGTAFNIILESALAFGAPIFAIILIRYIYKKASTVDFQEIANTLLILISFNLARNGLVTTLSLVKIYLSLFLLLFLAQKTYSFLFEKSKYTIINPSSQINQNNSAI